MRGDGLMRGGSSPAAPVARPTRAPTRGKKGSHSGVPDAGTSCNANIDDEPNIGSEGIMRGGSRPAAPGARPTRVSTRLNKGARSGVPDVETSSNVNIDDEPILVSDSIFSEDAQPDAPEFRYVSDEDEDDDEDDDDDDDEDDDDEDDEDVTKYVRAPRKLTPGQRYHTKQAAGRVRPSLSGSDFMGLNSDAFQKSPEPVQKSPELDHSSPEPVQRSPDLVWRSPDPVDMSPVMEKRISDHDIVTGRTVGKSAAPDKTGTIGLLVSYATGSSRQPITQRNNEIKGVIIRELGLSPNMIRTSLGHAAVSKKASSKSY
jgi:hypothetical protein